MKSIRVANLDFGTTESELRSHFKQYGEVHDVTILTHRDTGASIGVAFVDMAATAAERAIDALNGTRLGETHLQLSEA